MLHPTIDELTKNKVNRYELALATAKCARIITDEYVKQREIAEKSSATSKEMEKAFAEKVNKDYRDERAVKLAIQAIYNGEYVIVPHHDGIVEEETEETSEEE